MTPDGLKHAEAFKQAVLKAMEHAEEIVKTTNEWEQKEGDSYMSEPPLLKSNHSWEVDKEDFDNFERLVCFMRDILFGVDCDSDSAVLFNAIDRTRHENFLAACRVPRVAWKDRDLLKRHRQLELARIVVNSASSRLDALQRSYDDDIKSHLRRNRRLTRAKGCEECLGTGWVDTDFDTWFALDYSERCQTEELGCNFRLKEPLPGAKYRLFCNCQKEED